MTGNEIDRLYIDLNILARKNDWTALENYFAQFAESNSGSETANLIRGVNLDAYTTAVNEFLDRECKRLSHHAVRALYFEYDLNNRWSSTLHLCDRYTRSTSSNEE